MRRSGWVRSIHLRNATAPAAERKITCEAIRSTPTSSPSSDAACSAIAPQSNFLPGS